MATVNKSDLVHEVAKLSGYPISVIDEIASLFFKKAVEHLINEDTVKISGFGAFSVHIRKARTGINPKTLERIQIRPRKVVSFRAGKYLSQLYVQPEEEKDNKKN